jgi:type VI secretion system protein
MDADLFETLIGSFMDGTPLEAVPKEFKILFSIRDNLTRLFNSRRDLTPHLPDYGLPDFQYTHAKIPSTIREFGKAIKETMDEYEPRMKNVDVFEWKVNDKKPFLQCVIVGEIQGQKCRFRLQLIGMGANSVDFFKE